jgi:hypothetical protein
VCNPLSVGPSASASLSKRPRRKVCIGTIWNCMNHIVLCCYTCLPCSTSCNKLMWLTCQFVSLESIQHFCPHIVMSRYASVQIPLCYLGSNPSASAVKLRFVLKTNRTETWLRPFLISRKIDTRDKDNPFCLFRVEQRYTCLREAYRTCSPTSRAWICGNYPSRCDSPYKLHVPEGMST